jgi:hypothetical protein
MALIGLLMMLPAFQVSELTTGFHGQTDHEILPTSGPPVWLDSLDDQGHLFIPPGGLVGVDVSGGAARLRPGHDGGWIASEVIHAKEGYRYDLVMVEAETPGNSYIEVSILNATKEPSEIGFANETIDGYRLVRETELSVYSIGTRAFPELRIQLNLVANGEDCPMILSWALYYIANDEWRDDFLGTSKVEDASGVNITNGRVEIDLSRKTGGSGTGEYEAYPSLFGASSYNGLMHYAPNAGRTGYQDGALIPSTSGTIGVATADIDGDGLMDVVTSTDTTSYLMWGTEGETWSTSSSISWSITEPQRTAVGDFNGDGEPDVVFACNDYYSDAKSPVYLNDGARAFPTDPDVEYGEYSRVAVGDLNNDGYDDIAFSLKQADCDVYYGGPNGPSNSVGKTYNGNRVQEIVIEDIDSDGFLDLVLGDGQQGKAHIFSGSANGPDTTADHVVTFTYTYCYGLGVGDINGDGFSDIVFNSYNYPEYVVMVCPGTSQGWSTNDVTESVSERMVYSIEVADVDLDGYDDLIYAMYDTAVPGYYMRVAKGGAGIPTSHDLSMVGEWSWDIAVAIPRGPSATRTYRGSIETAPITLPQGHRWDVLHLDSSVPQNTTVSVTLLDSSGRPIAGYQGLETLDVDLHGLRYHRVIHVKVTMTSEFNWTTSTLDSLLVNWIGEDAWRDDFYGSSKIDRLLNMELDAGALGLLGNGDQNSQLLFASLRDDTGFNSESTLHVAKDGIDFGNGTRFGFAVKGASAVASADVNGDGYQDLAFATYQTSDTNYMAKSPLFLGSPLGWRRTPYHQFPSIGAADILMEDLDGDGHVDVVIAQERGTDGYDVDSVLFWGGPEGWKSTPDVAFATRGASGVVSTDLDGNGLADLVFSCYKGASTSTDSLVFLQEAAGFCGTAAHQLLPTNGARAVAQGDIDADGSIDLVFANSFSGGFAEIDSYVYWGTGDGAFHPTPARLPTKGAADVTLSDLDGDGDLDIVFANMKDNTKDHSIQSPVYLGDGTRSLPSAPSALLRTQGASAVSVADLDGSGWKDLVFACIGNGTAFGTDSRVFLGGVAGWSSGPDIMVPTKGASDVLASPLIKAGTSGYLSQRISVDPVTVGEFNTLEYNVDIDPSTSGVIRLVDATTWEVLSEATIEDGDGALSVVGAFKVKTHPEVRVMVALDGISSSSRFELYRVALNWTERVRRAPCVQGLELSIDQVYRLKGLTLNVSASDEFDEHMDLTVRVEHRLRFTDEWQDHLVGGMSFEDGAWRVDLYPRVDASPGTYVFRFNVTDSDGDHSGWVEFPDELVVRNNPPTVPEVDISEARPVTTSTLQVEVLRQATDLESSLLQYHYRWYLDGVLVPEAVSDTLPSSLTRRGQNWSREQLPDPEFDEDTTDVDWLNLLAAFEDPDGDALDFYLEAPTAHLTVTIDAVTGVVTLVPDRDWNGEEELTFVASDGELQTAQAVTVRVRPVNDPPEIVGINGFAIHSDPVVFEISQGETLVLQMDVIDVEGHDLVFSVNTTAVQIDEATGEIRFEPDNDAVGTLRFGLKVYDTESPSVKVTLNFTIVVGNENDPMDDPRITYPPNGETIKANTTFYLTAACFDPDVQYGQTLNYTWTSSLEGLMGHEGTLTTSLSQVGSHIITLTVTDGQYQKLAHLELHIEPETIVDPDPDPDPVDDDDGGGSSSGVIMMLAALAVIVGLGAGGYLVAVKRREDQKDRLVDIGDEPEELGHTAALRRMADAAKETADMLEGSKNGEGDVWVEAKVRNGIGIEVSNTPGTTLSIEAQVTQESSEDIAALWSDIETNGSSENGSVQDKEALRIENLKRKYQNAIGRLPYGIPSERLRDRDWVDLASALATGDRKTVEGGREVTIIDGRWYYSDHEDSSTFLKEHGSRPKAADRSRPTTDKASLLEKLEERFILGEITEETYIDLKKKLEG